MPTRPEDPDPTARPTDGWPRFVPREVACTRSWDTARRLGVIGVEAAVQVSRTSSSEDPAGVILPGRSMLRGREHAMRLRSAAVEGRTLCRGGAVCGRIVPRDKGRVNASLPENGTTPVSDPCCSQSHESYPWALESTPWRKWLSRTAVVGVSAISPDSIDGDG